MGPPDNPRREPQHLSPVDAFGEHQLQQAVVVERPRRDVEDAADVLPVADYGERHVLVE